MHYGYVRRSDPVFAAESRRVKTGRPIPCVKKRFASNATDYTHPAPGGVEDLHVKVLVPRPGDPAGPVAGIGDRLDQVRGPDRLSRHPDRHFRMIAMPPDVQLPGIGFQGEQLDTGITGDVPGEQCRRLCAPQSGKGEVTCALIPRMQTYRALGGVREKVPR